MFMIAKRLTKNSEADACVDCIKYNMGVLKGLGYIGLKRARS